MRKRYISFRPKKFPQTTRSTYFWQPNFQAHLVFGRCGRGRGGGQEMRVQQRGEDGVHFVRPIGAREYRESFMDVNNSLITNAYLTMWTCYDAAQR